MGLFAIRDYRHLFGAQVIALFGTGLATVALGLLAYELAGPRAGAVLSTALTIKMVLYVLIAPLAAAYVDRLPRRVFLVILDVIRAGVVLALPFVTEIWQIYLLIGLLQSASAAFTPTFQAVLPDLISKESDYTRALSASQLASTMESLLSPVLAAVALSLISFNWLFVGTSIGFIASAVLVLSARIPNARPAPVTNAWDRIAGGIRTFTTIPSLRGVLALNLVVAAAGSIVVVNTVNHIRDNLGGSQSEVAWMLAASGGGTLIVALLLPRILDRIAERTVMITGALVLVVAVIGAILTVTFAEGTVGWAATGISWWFIGAGMAMIITPTGRVLRRSTEPAGLPGVFAAQFSLSHLAWLITYPIAGWVALELGLNITWTILAVLAAIGSVLVFVAWPRRDSGTAPVPAPPIDTATSTATEIAACTLVAGQCACVRAV